MEHTLNIYPVILCGGSGERLWPFSRKYMPKQFFAQKDRPSMFAETLLRIKPLPLKAPLIVTNQDYRFMVGHQLAELHMVPQDILLEPERRNTAGSIAIAAEYLKHVDPEALMLVLPADHYFSGFDFFDAFLETVAREDLTDMLVTFGKTPSEPSTEYGYIEQSEAKDGLVRIVSFKEKPPKDTALTYCNARKYVWNLGIFFGYASTFLTKCGQYLPEILPAVETTLKQATKDLDFIRLEPESFSSIPAISFDYAVMEKLDNGMVYKVDADWNDLGSLRSYIEYMAQKQDSNYISGSVVAVDTKNCLLSSKKQLLVCQNVEKLQVIAEEDVIFITHTDRPHDCKKALHAIASQGLEKYNDYAIQDYRPWGKFKILAEEEGYKIKRLMLNPGQSISLQKHALRHEHWILINGEVQVTRGEEMITLKQNQSTFIPAGMVHKLENTSNQKVELIEMQLGSCFDEDDIERLEDMYKRAAL